MNKSVLDLNPTPPNSINLLLFFKPAWKVRVYCRFNKVFYSLIRTYSHAKSKKIKNGTSKKKSGRSKSGEIYGTVSFKTGRLVTLIKARSPIRGNATKIFCPLFVLFYCSPITRKPAKSFYIYLHYNFSASSQVALPNIGKRALTAVSASVTTAPPSRQYCLWWN